MITAVAFTRWTIEFVNEFENLDLAVDHICESILDQCDLPFFAFYDENEKHFATLTIRKIVNQYEAFIELNSDQHYIYYHLQYIMQDDLKQKTQKTAITIRTK